MKKTLRNIVGGLGLLVMVSGCTASGRQFSRDMGYTAVGTFIQESVAKEVWGSGQDRLEVNVNQGANYNSEERAILNQVKSMPRVVCVGDWDNDGDIDWVYHDGKGKKFKAVEVFKDERNTYSMKKNKEYFKREFHYLDGDIKIVSQNTLVIWYQD